jgi:general L-amino acid transport system permease protein
LYNYPAVCKWAFIDSFWLSTAEQCHAGDGACWSIIPANIRFIIFGFYPHELHWRPLVAMIMLVSLLLYSKNRDHWKKSLVYVWIAGLFIMGILMKGGLL